jgi:hypothetical protein
VDRQRANRRVRSADGRWGPVLRLTGHDRVPRADVPRIVGLGSSRFAIWTCVSPKASVDCNPVRLAIVGRSSVLRTIIIRPRKVQGFKVAPSPFAFGDQLDVVPDRGQALVVWTQRSSRGRKGEREVRTIRVGPATRRTPASKLLGRMTKTAVIDTATAPDGRAVALVTGAVSSCKAGVSGEPRYAAAAVRTRGRWGGLRRIACDGTVEGMRVSGTARGFLATWMREVTTTAGFRGAVTVSTYR